MYSQTIEGTGSEDKIVITKVKPPTPTQYPALAKQVDATAALAINGVRPQSLPGLITPETPKFDESEIERLETLSPDELAEYTRLRKKTAELESLAELGAEPVTDQE